MGLTGQDISLPNENISWEIKHSHTGSVASFSSNNDVTTETRMDQTAITILV